jgi:hypothetical protein
MKRTAKKDPIEERRQRYESWSHDLVNLLLTIEEIQDAEVWEDEDIPVGIEHDLKTIAQCAERVVEYLENAAEELDANNPQPAEAGI